MKKTISVLLCIIFMLWTVYTVSVSALSESSTEILTAESVSNSDKSFTVNAKSNIAQTVSKTYSEDVNQLTVTYYLKSNKPISDTEFNITYDSDVLAINKAQHTKVDDYGDVKEINFTPVFDEIGNTSSNLMRNAGSGLFIASSSLAPYDFSAENLTDNVFLTITFDVVGNYDKDVDIMLNVYVFTAVKVSTDGKYEFTEYIYRNEIKNSFEENCDRLTALSDGTFVSTEPPTTEPPTTEPPTTEPPTTEPPKTEPPTTEPPTTEPSTSEPPTTEPLTTESTTTEPPTTEPSTTEPPTTEPPTTQPPTTEPPVTNPTDLPKILGDADSDGEVNVKDATYIQLYLAKLLDEDEINLSVCDVNGDGHINIRDVTYIQLRLANLL